MPVTRTNPRPQPITFSPTTKPTLQQVQHERSAREAKDQVLALAEELKQYDGTPADMWTESGQVMIHDEEFRPNFWKKLLGEQPLVSARLEYDNGNLKTMEASIYPKSGYHAGTLATVYKYEALPNGDVTFARSIPSTRYETAYAGRDKVRSYTKTYPVITHDKATYLQSPNGTLTVDRGASVLYSTRPES